MFYALELLGPGIVVVTIGTIAVIGLCLDMAFTQEVEKPCIVVDKQHLKTNPPEHQMGGIVLPYESYELTLVEQNYPYATMKVDCSQKDFREVEKLHIVIVIAHRGFFTRSIYHREIKLTTTKQ